jgi:ferredoxin
LEESQQLPEFYLCGPVGFMQLAEEAITALAIGPQTIFKEHFFLPDANSAPDTDFSSFPKRVVRVVWQERDYSIVVTGGKSILQASLEEELLLPYSCKEGHCGVCRSRLVKGEIKMKHNFILDTEELASGQILLCQSFPLTDDVEVQPIPQAG